MNFKKLKKLLAFFIFFITANFKISNVKSNPIDLFGFDAKSSAQGKTGVNSSSVSSLYYNPGALVFSDNTELISGITVQKAWLKTPFGYENIRSPLYLHIGFAVKPPFEKELKDKVKIGVAIVSPISEMAWIKINEPSEVFYPYYLNRSQRTTTLLGMSFLLFNSKTYGKLGFGTTVNFFAGLNGGLATMEGASRSVEARMSFELKKIWSLNLGAKYEWGNWHFGFAYRDSFGVNFYTLSFNHVVGTDINMELDAQTLYSPKTFQYGVKYQNTKFSVSFDIVEELWSFYDYPFVKFNSVMPMAGDLKGTLPEYKFQNSPGFRSGINIKVSKELELLAGLGFQKRIIDKQTGVTNMLDGDKLTMSGGLTWSFSDNIKLSAFIAYQSILGFKTTKKIIVSECGETAISDQNALIDEVPCDEENPSSDGFQTKNPGFPGITSGGGVLSGGISLEVTK